MKNKLGKIVLAATLVLSSLLAFACSGNDNSNEQSYDYCIMADDTCLTGPFTTSTCKGQLSNNCPNANGGGFSSSIISGGSSSSKNNSSSSSIDNGGSNKKEVILSAFMTTVVYNTNGDVTGTGTNRYEYEYDSKGNQTKIITYNADKIIGITEYDSNGNQTKINSYIYNADGSIIITEIISEYEYDSKGNNTKIINYNADRNITGIAEYEYDSKGNQTKQVNYDADGNITQRIEYNCNSDTSYCSYNAYYSGTVETSYTGEVRYTTINSKKLTASQIITHSIKVEYEYDLIGNTTKMTQYLWQADMDSYVKSSETIYTYTYGNL